MTADLIELLCSEIQDLKQARDSLMYSYERFLPDH